MTRAKTIGFVSSSFPTHMGDTAGRFVFDMADGFVKNGYSVEVVVPEPPTDNEWANSEIWPEKIKVYPCRYMYPPHHQTLFFGAGAPDNMTRAPWIKGLIPPALFSLWRIVNRRIPHWDAVISHWLLPSAAVVSLSKKRPIPHLAIAHSGDVHLLKQLPLGHILTEFIARNASHVGSISNQLQQELSQLLPPSIHDRLRITPMGVFPETLTPSHSRSQIRHQLKLNKFTLLYLGRLVPIKGVDSLIDAMTTLPSCELLIAGDGPIKNQLAKQARTLGLNIRFLGQVSPNMRAQLLCACDAMVVPSRELKNGRHEGLPLVVIEAQMAGIPVIGTQTGAISEQITHNQTGLLISPESPFEIVRAVEILKNNKSLKRRLITQGKSVSNKKNWHFLVKMYQSLLFN